MRCVCEPNGDGQAPFGACAGGEGGVVGLGDGVDDREAETVAVAAAVPLGRRSLEGLEEALDLAAGDDWPAVGDREGRLSAGLAIQDTTNLHSLPLRPWVGLGVTAGWAAAALVAGGLLLRKRDA